MTLVHELFDTPSYIRYILIHLRTYLRDTPISLHQKLTKFPRNLHKFFKTLGPIINTAKNKIHSDLSCIMRKPAFYICKNKGADQLQHNCIADQRPSFRYIDSTI